MLMPFKRISPFCGVYILNNKFINVDLPLPFSPTKQKVFLKLIFIFTSFNAKLSLPGYLKDTFLNSIVKSFCGINNLVFLIDEFCSSGNSKNSNKCSKKSILLLLEARSAIRLKIEVSREIIDGA